MIATSEQRALDSEQIRADFPILATRLHATADHPGVPLVYLDNAATTQRPRSVIDAMVDCYEHSYGNVHRGIHVLAERATELYEQAREKVRALVGARAAEEIIFTRGTTESINLVARSWGESLQAGDEILLTEMEHHANIVPWQQLAERRGVVLRFLPITDDGQLVLDQLDALLTPRVRLVAVTAISNVLGTINPIAAIVRRARQVGSLVLLDAAQSMAHGGVDVANLDVDFLAFSGHKMFGPSGVGVLYGRAALLDAMPPFLGGGSMIRRVTLTGFEPAELPAKFEAGTPAIVPAIGLGAAVDYLRQFSAAEIVAHDAALCRAAYSRLAEVPGLRLLGPNPGSAERSAIVSFTLEGVHAHDLAQVLDRHGVAVRAGHHCTMPLHQRLGVSASARASFTLYNSEEEIEQLVAGVRAASEVFAGRKRGRS